MEVRRNQGLQLLVYGSVWNCHLFLWVNLAQALRFFKSQAASSLWGDELWERPGLCNCHVWSEYARCKVHWSWNCSFQAVAKVGNGTTLDLALETLWQNTITHISQAMWYHGWCLMHLHHKHEPFDQWMCARRIEEVQRRWFAYMADGKEHLHDFARFLKGVPCGSAVLKSDVSHCQCVRLQKTCLRVGRVETFPSKWQQLQNIDMSVTFMWSHSGQSSIVNLFVCQVAVYFLRPSS